MRLIPNTSEKMKVPGLDTPVLASTPVEATPATPVAVPVPGSVNPEEISKPILESVEQFKKDTLAQLQQWQDKFQKANQQELEPARQNTKDILALAGEIGDLRKALTELQRRPAAPTTSSTPVSPAGPDVDQFKKELSAQFEQWQDKVQQTHQKDLEPSRQNTRDILTLAAEIGELRKLIMEIQRPTGSAASAVPPPSTPTVEKPKEPRAAISASSEPAKPESQKLKPENKFETSAVKAAVPPKPPIDSKSSDSSKAFLDAIAKPAANTERKVVFFSKLWDYLNQPAFKEPPKKSDHAK